MANAETFYSPNDNYRQVFHPPEGKSIQKCFLCWVLSPLEKLSLCTPHTAGVSYDFLACSPLYFICSEKLSDFVLFNIATLFLLGSPSQTPIVLYLAIPILSFETLRSLSYFPSSCILLSSNLIFPNSLNLCQICFIYSLLCFKFSGIELFLVSEALRGQILPFVVSADSHSQ